MGRNTTCRGDEHTGACRSREALGRELIQWLQDPSATKLREHARDELDRRSGDHLPLTLWDMMALFLAWRRERASTWSSHEADTGIVHHRGISDMGQFSKVLDLAQAAVAEASLQKTDQKLLGGL